MKPRLMTPTFTDREIQHEAYLLWEAAGRPAGRDLDFWLAAQERLKHRARPRPAATGAARLARNAQSGPPAIR